MGWPLLPFKLSGSSFNTLSVSVIAFIQSSVFKSTGRKNNCLCDVLKK